ncbi:hypothetical protein [Methylobacterium sp. P1-11]|uniref:hypothetical protein n=1 Tax=Methylobacterium sp. P1-11 TaxID=2024616 RepID=UPI0032B29D3B
MSETGPPRTPLEGERARTVGQLRLFADLLTATPHLDRPGEHLAAGLVPRLARKAGRVLANGWPTGAEVAPAMLHGGPFPATSDGRCSSLDTLAIERFLRPVCHQERPDALLPSLLRPDNPWRRARRIDGVLAPQPGR